MDNIIVQLGLFFALSALLAVIFLYIKQSTVLAYIAVGIILGIFKSSIQLDQHTIHIVSEIGIILLLFLAGMELDLSEFKKRLRSTLTNGLGQIAAFTIIGTIIALVIIGVSNIVTAIYFGLCLAFSSTIIVIKLLKDRKEIESFYGQTLIGILILQDITAIFALVFINSLGGDQSILLSVISILGKMLGIGLFLFLFSRYILNYIFKKFAATPELLFIGTLGYVLGVAALCETIHFSPELGAFLAGVTLANIPYKLEIEDKVEPIKNLGVILFFVTLGFNLDFSSVTIGVIPIIVLISLVVMLGTPIVMLSLGYIQKLKSRPVFYLGIMLNQISEFSLILATLCLAAGVFDEQLFLIITLASILSILLSSTTSSFLDNLFLIFKKRLKFIDDHAIKYEDMEELNKLQLKNHIVILEYNPMADMLADLFAEQKKDVIILDFDPDKIEYIEKYESKYHHAIYADPLDPDIWEALKLEEASLIVSNIAENHKAEVALINYLKNHNSNAVSIIHSTEYKHALEMYDAGASYVFLPEHSAADKLIDIIKEFNFDFSKFHEIKIDHIKSIKYSKSKFMVT